MFENYPLTRKNSRSVLNSEISLCGETSRIILCPMMLSLEGEVVW
jgi:hypothetical protein